jgi:hypothetical protein
VVDQFDRAGAGRRRVHVRQAEEHGYVE